MGSPRRALAKTRERRAGSPVDSCDRATTSLRNGLLEATALAGPTRQDPSRDIAVRRENEVVWLVAAASGPGFILAPSHYVAGTARLRLEPPAMNGSSMRWWLPAPAARAAQTTS